MKGLIIFDIITVIMAIGGILKITSGVIYMIEMVMMLFFILAWIGFSSMIKELIRE